MPFAWLPWKFIVRRVARAHGFLDPIAVLARLHRFAQPAELIAPTELLRSGAVLHARGLMNSQAIQHNLDWVWPYWVVKQFDPRDPAFVPRAFSLTQINLTYRNWTAAGLPDAAVFPLVDPRGLLTPLYDGWSLDGWVLADDGRALLPSRLETVTQQCDLKAGWAIRTRSHCQGLSLEARVDVLPGPEGPRCHLTLTGAADAPAWLAVALRPYNPEGVSFLYDIAGLESGTGWQINKKELAFFSVSPDRWAYSRYEIGDVFHRLPEPGDRMTHVSCSVGMATAAALFRLTPNRPREVLVSVPLKSEAAAISPSNNGHAGHGAGYAAGWANALRNRCELAISDAKIVFLYEAALRALILHSPGDVFPGPYTYRRFWFRDAAFIVHALLCMGLKERAERVLDRFPSRQTRGGYFLSQNGEWDSNGEALWTLQRFCAMTGRPAKPAWRQAAYRGAQWIIRKRLPTQPESPHAGLLPAGFSAEHFGPNDYYYWDDFWAVAGLRSAASIAEGARDRVRAQRYRREADDLHGSIERSLETAARRVSLPAIPSSPYRRMDAAAIGSLVCAYPLQLWPADEPRLQQTVTYLLDHCFLDGGFFQEISHSGINPYLTLHVAQVLLQAQDPRALELLYAIAALASPTGQWPEAVHPRTKGGCMGDGQHIWASAEWLLMIRNCFVREEGGRLILGSGLPSSWLESEAVFGPTPTEFGDVTVRIRPEAGRFAVRWQGIWHQDEPRIEIRLPGCDSVTPPMGEESAIIPMQREAVTR